MTCKDTLSSASATVNHLHIHKVTARQPDDTVLNPAIFQILRVARFTSALWQSNGLHNVRLTQIIGFVGAKVFYRERAIAYPDHSFRTCGSPELFTSTTIFMKCNGKTSSVRQECYILKSHQELLYQRHQSFFKAHCMCRNHEWQF